MKQARRLRCIHNCQTTPPPVTSGWRKDPEDLLHGGPSLVRRVLTLGAALLFLSGTSLFATAAVDLDGKLMADKAVASSGPGKGGDDDDDSSGPGSGATTTRGETPTTPVPRRAPTRGPVATARTRGRTSGGTETPIRAAGATRPTPALATTAPATRTPVAREPLMTRSQTTAVTATPTPAAARPAATTRAARTTRAATTRAADPQHRSRGGGGPGLRVRPAVVIRRRRGLRRSRPGLRSRLRRRRRPGAAGAGGAGAATPSCRSRAGARTLELDVPGPGPAALGSGSSIRSALPGPDDPPAIGRRRGHSPSPDPERSGRSSLHRGRSPRRFGPLARRSRLAPLAVSWAAAVVVGALVASSSATAAPGRGSGAGTGGRAASGPCASVLAGPGTAACSSRPSGATAAPPTTAPVTSAVAQTFVATAAAPAALDHSATRTATGSEEVAQGRRASSPTGTRAVAPERSLLRARLRSCRTAPPLTPSSVAISSYERPSSSRNTIASRWREGSAATAPSTSRRPWLRSSAWSGCSTPSMSSGRSPCCSARSRSAFSAVLCTIR